MTGGGAADVIGGGVEPVPEGWFGDGAVVAGVVAAGGISSSMGCVTSEIVAVFCAAGRSATTSTSGRD